MTRRACVASSMLPFSTRMHASPRLADAMPLRCEVSDSSTTVSTRLGEMRLATRDQGTIGYAPQRGAAPLLLADIGGTNARFALLPPSATTPSHSRASALDSFSTRRRRRRLPGGPATRQPPAAALLAVAGPVRTTPPPSPTGAGRWTEPRSPRNSAAPCGGERLRGPGLSRPISAPPTSAAWVAGRPSPAHPWPCWGPARPRRRLPPAGDAAAVLATEGGHVTLAATDAAEAALVTIRN